MKIERYPSINPKFVQAIGRITIEFAVLEHTLTDGLSLLLILVMQHDAIEIDASTLAKILTAEMSFKIKVDTFGALTRHMIRSRTLDEKLQTALLGRLERQLDTLLKDVASIEEKRNMVTHSLWIRGDSSETAKRIKHRAKRKEGLLLQEENMDLEKLKSIAKSVKQTRHRLDTFITLELFIRLATVRKYRKKQDT
ncbi:MAG: hypothetical protein HY868_01105 [Chloroflexi bacterium]|nr:hypothetical protein [Chloroflexota bacterium]